METRLDVWGGGDKGGTQQDEEGFVVLQEARGGDEVGACADSGSAVGAPRFCFEQRVELRVEFLGDAMIKRRAGRACCLMHKCTMSWRGNLR